MGGETDSCLRLSSNTTKLQSERWQCQHQKICQGHSCLNRIEFHLLFKAPTAVSQRTCSTVPDGISNIFQHFSSNRLAKLSPNNRAPTSPPQSRGGHGWDVSSPLLVQRSLQQEQDHFLPPLSPQPQGSGPAGRGCGVRGCQCGARGCQPALRSSPPLPSSCGAAQAVPRRPLQLCRVGIVGGGARGSASAVTADPAAAVPRFAEGRGKGYFCLKHCCFCPPTRGAWAAALTAYWEKSAPGVSFPSK